MPSTIFKPMIAIGEVASMAAGSVDDLPAEQSAFAEALRGVYQEHALSLASGDIDRILAFFTDDAIWMSNGWPTREGRAGLHALFSEVAHVAAIGLESLYAHVEGDAGWNVVDYHIRPFDQSLTPWTFRTHFSFVRRSGRWLCNSVFSFTAPE